MSARAEERSGFDETVRIRLLETDVDEVEDDVKGIKQKLDRLTWAIVGGTITLSTSSILLAINIALQSGV